MTTGNARLADQARGELARALLSYKRSFIHIGVFSGVINILMLAPALYMLQVYDRVLTSNNTMTLLMLSLMVIMMYALLGALEWVRSLVVLRLSTGFDRTLAPRVYDAAFSANLKSGKLNAAQPLEDLQQLRQFATGQSLFAMFDAPWFPVYLLVMFMFHPLLGCFALAGTAILMFVGWLNERMTRPHLQQAGFLAITSRRDASANLRNAEVIAGMGMLAHLRQRWATQHLGYVREQNLASARMSAIQGWNKGLRLTIQSLALGVGAWLVLQHEMTAGMMIAGSILLGRALAPIDQLIGASRQWSRVKEAEKRLSQLLAEFPPLETGMDFPCPAGALNVESLTAAPPTQTQPVLRGIDFTLPAGETLAIIGSSGAGKSTLARCLVNAWSPLRGCVRLDDAPMTQWRSEALGARVGYLPQDVQLFAGSVAENIARFGDIDDSRVMDAAQMAGVHELILQLPEGYQTLLGENGMGLSGGQRQRVALARALYDRPRLVVLDEPNANLDQAGDAMLAQVIARIKQAQITCVVVTHKPDILKQADKLMVLHSGTQADFGPTAEVMQRIQRGNAPVQQVPSARPPHMTNRVTPLNRTGSADFTQRREGA
jgi:ATP-binding cassette, subfamily C, bacterial exporter for protease/lipase